MTRLRRELLLLCLPVAFLMALPLVNRPLIAVWREWSGNEWQIDQLEVRQPTALERFEGADCVAEIESEAPRRFRDSSVHLQRRFEVVAFDGVRTRSLWLWDGSQESPTKITRARSWSENVRGGNWRLCFSLATVPASWGEVRLLCDLEARDGQGGKRHWKHVLVLRKGGEKFNLPSLDRNAKFKALRMHLIERKPPLFAIELQYTPPIAADGKPGDAQWEELRWDKVHKKGRSYVLHTEWRLTDQDGNELETGMHEVTTVTDANTFRRIPNRYEAQVQLRDVPPPRGELWLEGRLSVDNNWPQDIKVHLRDAKGYWLENHQSEISIKAAIK